MKYKLTKKQKKMTIRIIIALALLAVIAVTLHFIELPWWAELILYAIPYAIAGYDVLKTAFINLIHGQIFDEKFLMMVATVGAFGTGEYPEASAVMLFYQVGVVESAFYKKAAAVGVPEGRPCDYFGKCT